MGHRLAKDEATAQHVPTWFAEQVLEQGHWNDNEPGKEPTPTNGRERLLLANLIHARRAAEMARVQLDAIEGLGRG